MPQGTVYSYYEPCVFNDLNIKTHNIGDSDFGYTSIIGEIDVMSSDDFSNKCDEMEKGKSVPMDFACGRREGLFNNEQLFAIYEDEDVEKLIYRLQTRKK